MNKPISPKDVAPPKVTTGPLAGSRKVYSSPEGNHELRVPCREIALTGGEPPFCLYDTSGPYTDEAAAIDVKRGLPRLRTPWIEARRGGLVTQLEFARAGIVTKEMAYIAHRENIGRVRAAEEAEARLADGDEFRRGDSSLRDARVRAQRSRARARHHPRQCQPPRIRADDHRAELPHQDQRQYRQFGRDQLGRGGGGEDGVGDPLGRRHRHGPLDRQEHPPHA